MPRTNPTSLASPTGLARRLARRLAAVLLTALGCLLAAPAMSAAQKTGAEGFAMDKS
ncbi:MULTISPECIES: hypothetical protein [Streptomyces]|uniref:hypothetical protein n=1 Tax=Streptomyces TaxID=1883 RepID=UPI001489C9CF|nr:MULTISPECIES: hypothetical protein [Streptomyces]